MDAHVQFKTIIYKWLRYTGLAFGQDIFMANFRINYWTIFALLENVSVLLFYAWTFYYFTYANELGMKAASNIPVAIKVSAQQIVFNHSPN